MSTKLIKNQDAVIFFLLLFIPAVIKQFLVAGLPLQATPSAIHDDALMVEQARSILAEQWLGSYGNLTFVKGVSGPLFLALGKILGISFIHLQTIYYSLASMIFIYAVRPMFKRRWFLFWMYVIILFNPVTFSQLALLRVYRCGMTMSQVLIIIGASMAVYLRRDRGWKPLLFWSLLNGFTLAFFWHTREDSFWLLPFVVGAMGVTAMLFLIKRSYRRLIFALLPFLMLWASGQVISAVNFFQYGVYMTNELGQGAFPDAMKSIYKIKPAQDSGNPRVAVTRDVLAQACESSPTLRLIEKELYAQYTAWDHLDTYPGDLEVENGWFFWSFREAAANAGYYTAPQDADQFYRAVHQELEAAFDDGSLTSRPVMPSALMAPWKTGYGSRLPKIMIKSGLFVSSFSTVTTQFDLIDGKSAAEFARIANAPVPSFETPAEILGTYHKSCQRLNSITWIYQHMNLGAVVLSLLVYIGLSAKCLSAACKRRPNPWTDIWLLTTAIGASLLVLIGGVSYNELSSCYSVHYMYLSGAYPLCLMFWTLTLFWMVERLLSVFPGGEAL